MAVRPSMGLICIPHIQYITCLWCLAGLYGSRTPKRLDAMQFLLLAIFIQHILARISSQCTKMHASIELCLVAAATLLALWYPLEISLVAALIVAQEMHSGHLTVATNSCETEKVSTNPLWRFRKRLQPPTTEKSTFRTLTSAKNVSKKFGLMKVRKKALYQFGWTPSNERVILTQILILVPDKPGDLVLVYTCEISISFRSLWKLF